MRCLRSNFIAASKRAFAIGLFFHYYLSLALASAGAARAVNLLLLALGGCTAVDVVEILHKKRQKLTGLKISVSGEQDADPPWAFRRMHLVYEVRGRGLSAKAVEQAVALSEDKYCSVRATLEGQVEITREVRIVEE